MSRVAKIFVFFLFIFAINVLPAKNLDVNARGEDGSSALMVACIKGYFPLVQLLLRTPGIVMSPPPRVRGAWLVDFGCLVAWLTNHSTNHSTNQPLNQPFIQPQEYHRSPLAQACYYGHIETIQVQMWGG